MFFHFLQEKVEPSLPVYSEYFPFKTVCYCNFFHTCKDRKLKVQNSIISTVNCYERRFYFTVAQSPPAFRLAYRCLHRSNPNVPITHIPGEKCPFAFLRQNSVNYIISGGRGSLSNTVNPAGYSDTCSFIAVKPDIICSL